MGRVKPHPELAGRHMTSLCLLITVNVLSGCGQTGTLTVGTPLHLEEHLTAATVNVAELPAGALQPVEWRFDESQPDWRVVSLDASPPFIRLEPVPRADSAPHLTMHASGTWWRGAYVDVPDWSLRDWDHVIIRARSTGPGRIHPVFNLRPPGEGPFVRTGGRGAFDRASSDYAPLVGDGTVQTYQIPLDADRQPWDDPVEQFGIWVQSPESTMLEILSITAVPVAAVFADAPAGVREVQRGRQIRRTLYTHAPGSIEYRIRVPDDGRLDFGVGVLANDVPVTFRVFVTGDGTGETVFEETCSDASAWHPRSVDLAGYAGREITLALENEAADTGSVAFWGAPTVSGSARLTEKPNVIFYVIDGAGAEYMSLYGYNRRTTPNLERLAAMGAVFERAWSNSSWTLPSTASFMTSLQRSVLGNNVVPGDVPTMAQHFHRAGYQTGVFTANPNAGKMSGLERKVDLHQEEWEQFTFDPGSGDFAQSSRFLAESFWRWREAYPGEPYWVHFQTVDNHGNFPAPAPFSGLFAGRRQAAQWLEWREARRRQEREARFSGLLGGRVSSMHEVPWEGIDRVTYYTVAQALYDEATAHTDYQIGRLVERLQATGEWENTLLIVASDHSISAAITDMGIAIQDSLPPLWNTFTILRPSVSRIPLLFVWPGHIEGGQRFQEPVSMVDVLPTILDLVGLPAPEVTMGQSLAPLLRGTGDWEPRPVILDEFGVDRSGERSGRIEVIDGRWGASLQINPWPIEEARSSTARGGSRSIEGSMSRMRPAPLLLYDLWNDPYCLHSIHEERPDLVEKYTAFLEEQWAAHQALAQMFSPSEPAPLTPEQLEILRALGYIR